MATKSIFVGGLPDEATEALVRAAFIPFGDLTEVHVPLEHATQKNKGFGFVEFVDEADAAAALENMNGAELCGKTLRVTASRPRVARNRPVWEDAQEWFNGLSKEGDGAGAGAADSTGAK
jgi:peptidyl-prolyl isomerase E (cyclophilin E)